MANTVQISTNQYVRAIPEGVPIAELATLANARTREFTKLEKMAYSVQKNKVFNPSTLKRRWVDEPTTYKELIRKLTRGKLLKFVTVEPLMFHPYLVAKFYDNAVIAPIEEFFATKVHKT